ncbi:ATP-binding protein [Actinomadura rugatobispora]|uniref:ATP-binding protein n=1 Tax=Actinomadura rugatobispora TaxID=1994 RepID=A0ABW1AGG2_9ACTN|nr:BTAD domain-containing putative transcriptional regulator [Actinomadura rugatobispora]
MRFGVLGAVEARSAGGAPVPLGGARARSLLAMLILDAGRPVGLRQLVDGLYGPHPPGDPGHALESQVSRLRRRLRAGGAAGPLIEFEPAGYRLAVDPGEVDLHRFGRLAADGRRALASGDHAGAVRLLGGALDLWRGPALADVRDAPFAEAEAARLEGLRAAAVEDLTEARLARGEHRALAAELPRVVAAHPLRERPRAQLMRALDGIGRRAEALRVFEDARRTLAEELGVDPSPELASAHLAILDAGRVLAEASPAGLPAQLTGFVGRAADLERVAALLGGERLVTLTGPGGVGKTRLAIEAAGREPGEVCFAELADVPGAGAVPQAVLGALGLRGAGPVPGLSGPRDPADRLAAGLAGRRTLLVLDGCERVAAAVARLARRLLGDCPDLRILVTSRVRLEVTGECLHAVAPLGVPAEAAPEAASAPVVRLFADRAAAVRPDFAAGGAGLGTVLRICRALDGLPLAIELAAARLRALTAEEVAELLDDRFGLLSRGDRSAPPRHRTLRSAIEWSWDLLDGPERELAARLTVFRGGATLEAVRRVCGGDVVGTLAALVDHSMVEAGGGRYRMLETVREFCAERLTGEAGRLEAAHAAYHLDLAVDADARLRGHGQLDVLARLDAERGNMDAALRWAVRADPVLGLRLIAALSWHGQLRGQAGERAAAAADLLAAAGGEPPRGLEEEYVLCLANAAAGDSGHDRELRARLQDLPPAPLRHPALSVVRLMVTGPRARQGPCDADAWSRAFTQLDEGMAHLLDDDHPRARRALEAALAGFRTTGDRWGVATALDQLATLTTPTWPSLTAPGASPTPNNGSAGTGMASTGSFGASDSPDGSSVGLGGPVGLGMAGGLLGEALELVGRLGAVEDVTRLLVRDADRLVAAGRLVDAWDGYERAAAHARRAGMPEAQAGAQRGLGDIARLRGDHDTARALYEEALLGCGRDSLSAAITRCRVLLGLGLLAEEAGDAALARAHYGRARRVALEHRVRPAAEAARDGERSVSGVSEGRPR